MVKSNSSNRNPKNLDPEKYARLKAEANAPFRGIRKFFYFSFGASGIIGAFIFFMQLLAGRNNENTLQNLILQVSVISLMVLLWRVDSAKLAKNPEKD
jgi:Na+/melibiose symporter-like transporter